MHNLYIIVSHLILYNDDCWYDNICIFFMSWYVIKICVCYYICFPLFGVMIIQSDISYGGEIDAWWVVDGLDLIRPTDWTGRPT